MIKVMLKISKVAYVIGLLNVCKNWVKRCALNRLNVHRQADSWKLKLTYF